MLPSGQLQNPATGLCLSTEGRNWRRGTRVVAARCSGGTVGYTLRPDQFWSRGSEHESFNLTGLSHIGMYPDLIQDLKNIGVTDRDLLPLFQSAEGYLQMWERTGWTRAVEYAALSSDAEWKYSTTFGRGWQHADYDDTAWLAVGDTASPAPYGAPPWGTSVKGFPEPTPARWLPIPEGSTYYFRRTFVSDAGRTTRTVTVAADDGASIYFDGVQLATLSDWREPATFTLPADRSGVHVIAIAATNKSGPGGVLVDVR
jgi:hypothetical protein